MNFRRPLRLLAVLAVSALFGGCISSEERTEKSSSVLLVPEPRVVFAEVAEQLDANGTYYRVQNPRFLIEKVETLSEEFGTALQRSNLPQTQRDQVALVHGGLELVCQLLGLGEIQGFGASSIPVAVSRNPGETIFRNRYFINLPKNARGALWQLDGNRSRQLEPEWNTLPANTVLAANYYLDPTVLLDALKQVPEIEQNFDETCRELFQRPARQVLSEHTGEWMLVILNDDHQNRQPAAPLQVLLALPDQDRKLFALLEKTLPALQSTLKTLFPEPLQLHWADGTLYLASADAALPANWKNQKPLCETPEFRKLAAEVPQDGVGFLYLSSRFNEWFTTSPLLAQYDFLMDQSGCIPSLLEVQQSLPNGKLFISAATADLNEIESTGTLLMLWFSIGNGLEKLIPETAENPSEAVEPPNPEQLAACREKLQKLNTGLQHYAETHEGNFPDQPTLAGLKQLLTAEHIPAEVLLCPASSDELAESLDLLEIENCSYLYFNGFNQKSNPKFPLLVDWPYNHAGTFNILFVDGSVESVADLEDISNCKRIASYLHTRFHFSESELRELFAKADKIDQEFELE